MTRRPDLFGRIQIFRKHKTDKHHDRKRQDEQHDQPVSVLCAHLQVILNKCIELNNAQSISQINTASALRPQAGNVFQVALPMHSGSIWNRGHEGEDLLPGEFVPWRSATRNVFLLSRRPVEDVGFERRIIWQIGPGDGTLRG
jgi:hypothetical protein